ncbi:aromatic amino acid ammonia-lyase [Amycolatopsis regifaucium]|uniref:Histidine ammonia-lyase n=1 Tax=Amycolatopsis regifaucium TaxID=546365 RepID=A0A154MVM3_9PSEU|nr:aromatic amino acid ammonia-lyase [Amycolatopsis regifaucium]KZB88398.1 histidine ammonia-lyase [Amycolatopsis regifaucium]OKA04509.1 histidine ammonia-lyase [Amycolatopsis regifaucium]
MDLVGRPTKVELSENAIASITRGREFVEGVLARNGRPVYGATTGFGPLVVFEGRDSTTDQCDNVLQHLTVGQGADLPIPVARASMLVRARSLAHGLSGASLSTVDALCRMLATGFTPAIPTWGSVGASGDLVPLAHAVQSLRGVGHAYVDGERMPARDALGVAGLTPLELDGRDALALVNGTSVTTAAAGLAALSARRSLQVAIALTAALADLLGAAPTFAAPSLLKAFGHPDVATTGQELAWWLEGSIPSPDRPLQEPYSIRCTPQLLGAARSAIGWSTETVSQDLRGVSDNPLFFPDEDLVAHGGNFFGQPSAFASDLLASAVTQVGNLAERQIDLLVDPGRNGGRPPMLAAEPGRQHSIQGLQVMSTALVVAMRRACTPAAMQSVPTNLHNQDVVPFGTQAALTAYEQSRMLRLLHGALGVAVRQAAHLDDRGSTASHCTGLVAALSDRIDPITRDRPLDEDIRIAADVLDSYVQEANPWTPR